MIGEDVPPSEPAENANGDMLPDDHASSPEHASRYEDDAHQAIEVAKRFGFSSRDQDGDSDMAGEAPTSPPPSTGEHDLAHQSAPLPPSPPAEPAVRPMIAENAKRELPSQGLPPDADGSVVSTPHIERLRAQFDHAPDTATPPNVAEPTESRVMPAETGDHWKVSPKPAQHHVPHEPEIKPVPRRPEPRPAETRSIPNDVPAVVDDAAPVEAAEEDAPAFNPDEEIAVTIGRVVSIRGSVIWGALFDDIDGKASKAARMGALVSMRGPDSRVFGIVNRLQREQQAGNAQAERTVFEVQILGEIADEKMGFQRGVSSYPPLDAPVTTITIRDIATIYARPRSSNVHIGQLRHNQRVPAFVLTDNLLGKHFAVLGTTGTGKSCATTVILRSILEEHPQGHVVLIDPHNEYGPAFTDRAELLNPANLQLPYWLLNFEEIAHIVLHGASRQQAQSQGSLLKDAIVRAKNQFAGTHGDDNVITVDTPVPYRLSDLVSILKEGMGTFNKAEGSALYLSLINRIEGLRADKRFAFMFSSLAVRDNMEQVLAQLLRIPTNGKPITIIDISGLPSDVVDVVVAVLFRLTFELAVWSERGKAPPVLLVCEEAHRYVPEQSDVGFAPTKRVIAQIAKEGRKYGVTLCLVSQRPSELAVSSLAQCNTIFALRMSNEHDQAFVSQTLSENARWLVDSLPSLNTQEAVVVGDGVTVPVHIRFKDLPPDHRPASNDPSFARSWVQEADPGFLPTAIDRWRRQAR
jgi:DNA helicase HerA-like ATPase